MRFVLVAFLIFFAVPLSAGEDVIPYDSAGHVLSTNHIDRLEPKTTCGGCHDVNSKLKLNNHKAHSDSRACLDCHLTPGKEAFTPAGKIRKLCIPSNQACLNCHPEADPGQMTFKPAHSHKCIDCHANAGHQPASPPACASCHLGKKNVPWPIHSGLTQRHIDRIACETCHIRDGVASYGLAGGKLVPLASDGSVIHHGATQAPVALGASGCTNCHSSGSAIAKYQGISGIREGIVKPMIPKAAIALLGLCLAHYAIFGPKRVKTVVGEPRVVRFRLLERTIHLVSMLSFSYLAITGLMFLMHIENPASHLRSIHGCIGGVFTLSTFGMLIIWWRQSLFTACDADWLRKLGGYLWIKADCRAGKFNAGQKIFFWAMAMGCGLVICITGIALDITHGLAAGWVFTLHDTAAAALLLSLMGHIYLSIFANPGALVSVFTGYVTAKWAEKHHTDWHIHNNCTNQTSIHKDGKKY